MDKKELNNLDRPVLVFDKGSELGQVIAGELAEDYLCVLVSDNSSINSKNIIRIPLAKKIPTLPKCIYKAFILHYTPDKAILDLLSFFINKATEDNAHIYIVLNIRCASEELINHFLDKSSRITILLVGDVFGDSLKENNPAMRLLAQASFGRVILKDALSFIYPSSIAEVLSAIKRIIAIKGVPGHRILYFMPTHPITALSFVRAIKKKEPLVKVDILGEKETDKDFFIPRSYQSIFGPSYNYEKFLPKIAIRKPKITTKTKRKIFSVVKYRTNSFFTILVFSILISVFGLPLFSGVLGAGFLVRAKTHVLANDFYKARASVKTAKMFFSLSKRSMKGLSPFSFLGLGDKLESLNSGVNTGKLISETALFGLEGAINFKNVFSKDSSDPKGDLLSGIQNFRQAVLGASVIKAEGKIPDSYLKYISAADRISGFVDGTFDVLPEILGMEKKKRYLVLFQNNMELRPGGGFIGSYGVLEIDKGRIVNFQIYDVYDADGQLSQHIEPPFQLRKYMGINHWYLRDSNFELEFSKNGALASFFYNAETKDTVDGVMGIDVSFLKKMLSITGPLKVAGYDDTITSDNFFKLTESYAQDNFFPGSNQKQNFLKAVATSLFEKLSEDESISYSALIRVLAESISEKHLLFAFPDKNIQDIFNLSGASASLNDARLDQKGVINDFLGINEANLGENKVNYYLDRSIFHKVDLSTSDRVIEELSIHYINRSKKSDKYGGGYKAYLRFILPKGAELQAVAFGDEIQKTVPAVMDPAVFSSPGYTYQGGLELERTELNDKTIYGFLIFVPQSSKKTITINYALKTTQGPNAQMIDYSLRLFKQPGTDSDSYAFSFINPTSYKILNASEGIRINSSGLSLLTNLLEDQEIKIKLGKR